MLRVPLHGGLHLLSMPGSRLTRGNPPPRAPRFAQREDGSFLDFLPGGRIALSATASSLDEARISMEFGSARRAAARVPNLLQQYGDRLQSIQVSAGVDRAGNAFRAPFSVHRTNRGGGRWPSPASTFLPLSLQSRHVAAVSMHSVRTSSRETTRHPWEHIWTWMQYFRWGWTFQRTRSQFLPGSVRHISWVRPFSLVRSSSL